MKKSLIAVCIVLSSSFLMNGIPLLPHPIHRNAPPVRAAEILKIDIPIVVHGFSKASFLPDGDLFLLPKPLKMAVVDAPEGAQVFRVDLETFGAEPENAGGLPDTPLQGLSFSTSNASVRALSCAESIWDSNLMIASSGSTAGDAVRLFVEYPDGSKGPELALFTVADAGVVVTQLRSDLMLFVNDRYARGQAWHAGDHIAFTESAGRSGMRTQLLTFAWPMGASSALQGCFRLGVEITRGHNSGTTSVVFTDIVVNRNRIAGDENNAGVGLLGRLSGGYPSGVPCEAACPFPDDSIDQPIPDPNTYLGNGESCKTICFRSPRYFLINPGQRPHGVVMIGGAGTTRLVSATDTRSITPILGGGRTTLQQLNREFVAAQMNLLLAGGPPSSKHHEAMRGLLKCYGLKFEPAVLSNGFEITPNNKLDDLFTQTRLAIEGKNAEDQNVLANIFSLLNGDDTSQLCHNLW
jgi:hypothetical protein